MEYQGDCIICGDKFTTSYKRKKYCSEKCKSKASYLKRVEDHEVFIATCVGCGVEIKSFFKGRKTCGKKECRSELRRRYKRKIYNDLATEMSVEEVRNYYMLKPIEKGIISCLSCGEKFKSTDTKANRLCRRCNIIASDLVDMDFVIHDKYISGRVSE